eukprot:2757758-Rhodomonas_salina.1
MSVPAQRMASPNALCRYRTSHSECIGRYPHTRCQYQTAYLSPFAQRFSLVRCGPLLPLYHHTLGQYRTSRSTAYRHTLGQYRTSHSTICSLSSVIPGAGETQREKGEPEI